MSIKCFHGAKTG